MVIITSIVVVAAAVVVVGFFATSDKATAHYLISIYESRLEVCAIKRTRNQGIYHLSSIIHCEEA